MSKNFDANDFFKYTVEHLKKEENIENSLWVGRALNFIVMINTIYDLAFEKFKIVKSTDNYQHLFNLDTLNSLYNEYPYILKTQELHQYLSHLPGYYENQPITVNSYELHGYVAMIAQYHFNNYIVEKNLLIDKSTKCPYENYYINQEKKQLEQNLLVLKDSQINKHCKI